MYILISLTSNSISVQNAYKRLLTFEINRISYVNLWATFTSIYIILNLLKHTEVCIIGKKTKKKIRHFTRKYKGGINKPNALEFKIMEL